MQCTVAHAVPPDQPAGVTAVQSGPTSIRVFWTESTSGGLVRRYEVCYVTNGVLNATCGSTTFTYYLLNNLQVGLQYYISVIAVGDLMPSQFASVLQTVCKSPLLHITECNHGFFKLAPGPVKGLMRLNNSFTTITLTWQPPSDPNRIIYYQVTFSTNDGSVNTYTTIQTMLTITGLVPRTMYTFTVVDYTITGPGAPLQLQTSTAAVRKCNHSPLQVCMFMHVYS